MFQIYYEDKLIGHSQLEKGDPPMGVAHGEFLPNKAFDEVKKHFDHIEKDIWRLENLTLKTNNRISADRDFDVGILAYESLEDPFFLEVSAFAKVSEAYEALFLHHIKAYEEHYKD